MLDVVDVVVDVVAEVAAVVVITNGVFGAAGATLNIMIFPAKCVAPLSVRNNRVNAPHYSVIHSHSKPVPRMFRIMSALGRTAYLDQSSCYYC